MHSHCCSLSKASEKPEARPVCETRVKEATVEDTVSFRPLSRPPVERLVEEGGDSTFGVEWSFKRASAVEQLAKSIADLLMTKVWHVFQDLVPVLNKLLLVSSDRSSYSDSVLLLVRGKVTFSDFEHFCQYI